MRHSILVLSIVLTAALMPPYSYGAAAPVFGVEAEAFEFPGGWTVSRGNSAHSGSMYLSAGAGAHWPAVTAIDIPESGSYTLWVRAAASREAGRFTVSVGGKPSAKPFGASGGAEWSWQKGDSFALPAGAALLAIYDSEDTHEGRADALLLSRDPAFTPDGKIGAGRMVRVKPAALDLAPEDNSVSMSPVMDGDPDTALATLANEHVRVSFIRATRKGKASARPVVEVKVPGGWLKAPIDASAESYQILTAPGDTAIRFPQGTSSRAGRAAGQGSSPPAREEPRCKPAAMAAGSCGTPEWARSAS